ncbi:MAG TPA: hypothetical protein VFY90_08185 [Tepidiformaceae bacterium]|nr:hypothetical protein [Tepidiformaceae bacterium]
MDTVMDRGRGPSGVLPLSRDVPIVDERDSMWVVDLATGRIVRRLAGSAPATPHAAETAS